VKSPPPDAPRPGTASQHRIAIVVPKYGLIGGGERFASELTDRLAGDKRFDIHVFANQWQPGSGNIVYHKVPMLRFPRTLRPVSFAWFANRMIARGNFDIVHSHERIYRADVFTMHAVPHKGWIRDVRRKRPSLFDRAIIRLERKMMANARTAWFLPVSTLAALAIQREYDVDPARVRIIHPGVDAGHFSDPDRTVCREDIRARYGMGISDFLVLFVGMNFEVKGLDAVIAAVGKARLAKPRAGIRLLVVGRGNIRKYTELARMRGIADAVTFAGPQASDIECYYRAADIFVMLSTFDTFGMAVLEAMAAGLPVIVSPNVGAKDVVVDGVNGYVMPATDDDGAVAKAIAALTDADLCARFGAEAQRTARLHSWERVASMVAHVYEEVIDRHLDRR
jgi:UDP-glucose:(heptosyl)LPS alpha-1,3-glucosyltransferase